ncbi:hypothetical protein Taro_027026 [Colocasia esculenta]|uniref:Uncharacterized protein n=1 Tax=Colocasia esculenta TaxID=4460 RepID=A0A843VIW4_COLES|nr:hypothetical protein [Colocasia esculenta]
MPEKRLNSHMRTTLDEYPGCPQRRTLDPSSALPLRRPNPPDPSLAGECPLHSAPPSSCPIVRALSLT